MDKSQLSLRSLLLLCAAVPIWLFLIVVVQQTKDWRKAGRCADVSRHGESPMTDSSARTTMLVRRLLTCLCFVAACTVVSAQEASDGTSNRAELDHARQLIRDTPCPGRGRGALAEIRVVNCLHSLGKDQAVSLLREIAPAERMDRTMILVVDPDCPKAGEEDENLKYLDALWDAQRVCLIVPLLFDVEQGGTPPPATWYDKDTHRWSVLCSTLAIQDGIPFDVWEFWSMGGCPPEGTLPLVEWAAAHGKLRKQPLRPTDDPLRAADALHERGIVGAVPESSAEGWRSDEQGMERFRDHLRAQAIEMLPNRSRIVGV